MIETWILLSGFRSIVGTDMFDIRYELQLIILQPMLTILKLTLAYIETHTDESE